VWRATSKNFPAGPSEGLRRWSLGPLNNNPLEYFTKVGPRICDIAGLRVLNFKTIFINHPGLIEEVLVTNARKYTKGRRAGERNRHVFGEGLLTSEGDFWLRQRRLAQPAFHRVRIASYAATMVSNTERLLGGWPERGEERDAHQRDDAARAANRGKTLFGADVERDTQEVGNRWNCCWKSAQFPGAPSLCRIGYRRPRIAVKREVAQIEKILYRYCGTPRFRPRRRGSAVDVASRSGRGRFANDGPAAS